MRQRKGSDALPASPPAAPGTVNPTPLPASATSLGPAASPSTPGCSAPPLSMSAPGPEACWSEVEAEEEEESPAISGAASEPAGPRPEPLARAGRTRVSSQLR